MKYFIFSILLSFAALQAQAEFVSADPILSSYSVNKRSLSPQQLKTISEQYEISHSSANHYEVIVDENHQQDFLKNAPSAQLISADISAAPRARIAAEKITRSLFPPSTKLTKNAQVPFEHASYHSLDEVQTILKNWAIAYPHLVEYFEYGTTPQGHILMGIKISDNVTLEEAEPKLMITAATHGDEIITTEILLGLIEKLLIGHNVDPRLTKMIDAHEIYFIPALNPDGFSKQYRYDNGVDPNRSYPYPENPRAVSSPATTKIMDFFHSKNFSGSLDFHAYGRLVMFPWAYTRDHIIPADYTQFDLLTASMAQQNVYTHGPIAEVIYIAKGSSCDYYYWQNKTTSVAIEVGFDKSPPVELIESYTDEQTESTWRFIENFL